MTTFVDRFPTSKAIGLYLAVLVATVMALQTVGPDPVLALYLLIGFVGFFYTRSSWLLMLWPGFLALSQIFRDLTFRAGPILLLPLDPAYFLSLACFAIAALNRPRTLISSLKANPYLSLFLLILVAYTIFFTQFYGKSAIGEARKFYLFFILPVLMVFFVKTMRDLQNVLLVFIFGGLCLLVIGYARLGTGTGVRALVHASAALTLMFIVFTIIVFHLNKKVLINRNVDLMIFGLSVPIILMTQHRTVLMTGTLGLCLLLWLYRHRTKILVKVTTAVLAFMILLGIVVTSVPAFERYTMQKIAGLINPSADRTGSWRIQGWQQQLAELSGPSLLFGEGLGSYYSWMAGRYEVKTAPHNAYVQLVLKFGLLGLLVYVLVAFRFFRTTLSVRRKLPPGRTRAYIEVGIVNYGAAHAYMLGYGFDLSMLIFFALAMGAVSLLRSRQEATMLA